MSDTNHSPHEHLDVIIVGAGISGIDAAYRIRERLPNKRLAILEMRDDLGGTWDLFRYPGIRSDSDMTTLGFPFGPWDSDLRIADGDKIKRYIKDTAEKNLLNSLIRYGCKVLTAKWVGNDGHWRLLVNTPSGDITITCSYLHICTGYYDYKNGYMPEFPEIDRFRGQIVHPQAWPNDLDCSGKRVVVIGSGATAISLAPALVQLGAKVTLLQRSPTYVLNLTRTDRLATRLRKILPRNIAYRATRTKNILLGLLSYSYSRFAPSQVRQMLQELAQKQLGQSVDAGIHFNPRYKPWDQRLCVAPDGDLFRILKENKATIVTDHIERFTESGIETKSGALLEADIVVSATGLNVLLFGGMKVSVDGIDISPSDRFVYKSMMIDGVPNFSFAFGYTNASWTLKSDLVAKQVCQLLSYKDAKKLKVCVPKINHSLRPLAMVGLSAGYVERGLAVMPKQAAQKQWKIRQNYIVDYMLSLVSKPAESDLYYFESAMEYDAEGYEAQRHRLLSS